jgi:hypothetical protein
MSGTTTEFDAKMHNWQEFHVFAERWVLNPLDKTIIFTPISAELRSCLAVVQGAAGFVFSVHYAGQAYRAGDDEDRKMYKERQVRCGEMMMHAGLNYGRAKVAGVFALGSGALMVYDWFLQDRIKYMDEDIAAPEAKAYQVLQATTDFVSKSAEKAQKTFSAAYRAGESYVSETSAKVQSYYKNLAVVN